MSDSKIKINLKATKRYFDIAKEKHDDRTNISTQKECWIFHNGMEERVSKIWCSACCNHFATEESFLKAHKVKKGGQG